RYPSGTAPRGFRTGRGEARILQSLAATDRLLIGQMAPAFFDLSARAKLRVSGADRIRFLNGQTTNDVRKAGAEATQESCVLNAKGHLDAHIFLSATPNDIWIDADQELRELLQTRLERYVIADDVKIEDVTDQSELL